jgi:hypothetical protein
MVRCNKYDSVSNCGKDQNLYLRNPFAEAYPQFNELSNYDMLCSQICSLHPNIVGAWTFRLKTLIASRVKPIFAEVKKQDQEDMFVQAQLMIAFAESHEKLYGRLRYVLVSFEHFDAYLISLGKKEVLSVGCFKPNLGKEIVESIEEVIASTLGK